mmetsp:Transcript_19295/g.45991  ORF Transcript_19295/g.45991 Transcript_19295/m.45991 type:complete len:82 (+) Transcript_19295:1001-1246(+)
MASSMRQKTGRRGMMPNGMTRKNGHLFKRGNQLMNMKTILHQEMTLMALEQPRSRCYSQGLAARSRFAAPVEEPHCLQWLA